MNYLLGADLNGNQLKIAAFKKGRGSFELIKLDSLILPNDEGETLSQLILWKEKNLPESGSIRVILTISESTLYLKEIELPKLPNDQLTEAIYWEIPSIAPISQAESVFDWKIISEGKDSYKVLVIVGKSIFIENIISTFSKASMEIVAIEPSSYAFSRIVNANFNLNTLVSFAEERSVDFMVLKKGVPIFSTSNFSGVGAGKASHIKNDKDLTNEITGGAKKIIEYWEEKESSKIEQVILAGDLVYKYFGISVAANFLPSVPVFIGNSRKIKSLKIKNLKEIDVIRFLIPMGAGIRHLQKDVYDGINLFPASERKKIESVRKQKKLSNQFLGFIYTNIILLVLVVVSIFAFNMWWLSLEKQLDELNKLATQHPANALIKEVNETNQIIENAISLANSQEDIGSKLKIITSQAPQTVKLSAINMTNIKREEWKIDGTGDRASILAFYENMLQNGKETELSMPYSNLEKDKDNNFSIFITW